MIPFDLGDWFASTAYEGSLVLAVVTGWWDVLVDWIRTWFFPGFEAGV